MFWEVFWMAFALIGGTTLAMALVAAIVLGPVWLFTFFYNR